MSAVVDVHARKLGGAVGACSDSLYMKCRERERVVVYSLSGGFIILRYVGLYRNAVVREIILAKAASGLLPDLFSVEVLYPVGLPSKIPPVLPTATLSLPCPSSPDSLRSRTI